MTTDCVIIAGFFLMVVLMGVVAVTGYNAAVRSADGFVEYRRQARFNVITNDFETVLSKSVTSLDAFLSFRQE